jgi:hypothetical protein
LPEEFSTVLDLLRNIYYEDKRTPDRPTTFDSDREIFGKVVVEEQPDRPESLRRRSRNTSRT